MTGILRMLEFLQDSLACQPESLALPFTGRRLWGHPRPGLSRLLIGF